MNFMGIILLLVAGLGISLVQMVATMRADDGSPAHGLPPYPADMNKKFADPDMDIHEFVKRFENEDRDVYVKRQDIIRAWACGLAMP